MRCVMALKLSSCHRFCLESSESSCGCCDITVKALSMWHIRSFKSWNACRYFYQALEFTKLSHILSHNHHNHSVWLHFILIWQMRRKFWKAIKAFSKSQQPVMMEVKLGSCSPCLHNWQLQLRWSWCMNVSMSSHSGWIRNRNGKFQEALAESCFLLPKHSSHFPLTLLPTWNLPLCSSAWRPS